MYLYPDSPELGYDPVLDYQREFGSSREVEESATPSTTNVVLPTTTGEDATGEVEVIEVIVGLWYWWKEVALISVVTAAVMNCLFHRPDVAALALRIRRWIEQFVMPGGGRREVRLSDRGS